MPLHPQARRLLDMIAVGQTGEWSVSGRRAGLAGLARIAGGRPDANVAVEATSVPGAAGALPARLYAPAALATPPHAEMPAAGRLRSTHHGRTSFEAPLSGAPRDEDGGAFRPSSRDEDQGSRKAASAPGLVFFHGGGFVAGSLDDHDGFCRALAALSGCRVLSVGYRLAPEHPFPAAIEDGLAAARAVVRDPGGWGLDRDRLAIGGNSAGGGIAARICQELAQAGDRPFAAQLLLCPVLDAEGVETSWTDYATGHLLDVATFRADAAASGIAALPPDDARASPLQARDLSGLPPAMIHTAECDIVRDGGHAYAERLRGAGIAVRATCHPGTLHDFYMLTGLVPSFRPALARIAAELRAALVPDPVPC